MFAIILSGVIINMKVRNGFVSNSSSSSFIIPKEYISKEQITKYRHLSDREDYPGCHESTYHESNLYIYGSVSYHDAVMRDFLGVFHGKPGVDYEGY